MRWPLDSFTITQGYHKGHAANDLAAPLNTAIKAPDSGTVIDNLTNWKPGGYFGGNYVKIKGNSGYTFYMGHMNSVSVKVGQTIKEGQTIGKVGSTGISTGPHIHFEMSKGNVMYDPSSIIKESNDMTAAEKVTYNKGIVSQSVKPLSEGNIIFEFIKAGSQWRLDTVVAGKAVASAKVKAGHRITCQAFVNLKYGGKKQRYYITQTDLKSGKLYGVNSHDVKIIATYK